MKRARNASYPLLVLAALLFGSALVAAVDQALPREGTFSGDWSVHGTVEQVEMEGSPATLGRLEGKVTLTSSGGLAREFDALCFSVSNSETGGVARCAWTDATGDTLHLELSGSIIGPAGTVREARGSVIGGTGRYAGVEGTFQLDWLFVESTIDDKRFKGYVTELEGSWKRP